MIEELLECRVCKSSSLVEVLNLGNLYPSGFLKPDEELKVGMKTPLVLCRCGDCGLVQLKHTVELDLMYRQYWYTSSLNKSMVSSLKNVVDDIESRLVINDNDTVVDIGCNDGTMLSMYSNKNIFKVGYDPALNLSRKSDYYFINNYFSSDSYFDICGHLKARIITAIAMFYDLPDPLKFVKDVASILRDDGLFVIQFTDLLSMFKVTAFDNICHEHLEYYRLEDVVRILNKAGLDAIDVSYNDVNGGSLRVTAAHEGRFPRRRSVEETLVDEANFFKSNTFDTFKSKIDATILKMRGFLDWCKFHNHKIILLGASTKGNTFLQICGITNKDIPFAAEVNKDKFGLRTAGSGIEIISEEDALIKHPDYFIVPVWHFKQSFYSNKKILDYMLSNGRLVFPLPEFVVAYLDSNNIIKEVRI